MTDVKDQSIDELFERGFFHDIYVEALRLKKENADLRDRLILAVEHLKYLEGRLRRPEPPPANR